MADSFEDILNQALALPREQRILLAERLLVTLRTENGRDIDAAWVEEAERRYAAYVAGEVEGIPADEVMAQARRELFGE